MEVSENEVHEFLKGIYIFYIFAWPAYFDGG
jgi:hypothetical protein